MDLADGVARGEARAAAKLISAIEREDPGVVETLQKLHKHTGDAHVVGITGSPGTGKSTLTDRLIDHYRQQDKRVAVIAVDPSSPFTGGAILGDRIRMQNWATDPDVFIRSMGSRGALGGLSAYTADAVRVLDAMGNDVILVETVGVGQAEVEVIRLADTVVLVLVPNLGDDVQAVKAGVMEIADLFVINKSDLRGADKVAAEVEAMMGLAHPGEDDWWPPLLRTTAENGDGVPELAAAIDKHRQWSQASGTWHTRRQRRTRNQIRSLIERQVTGFAFEDDGDIREEFLPLLEKARAGDISPHTAAQEILQRFCK